MEIPSEITYDKPLVPAFKALLNKKGKTILPKLIPGSSRGTILEDSIDVAIIKNNPTWQNWHLFLKKIEFTDYCDRLFNVENNCWPIRYALARTFTGKNVAYDLYVTADMFSQDSFMCFPEAMSHIIKCGVLDCDINWSQADYIEVRATLDYRDHYPDRNADGISMFYWYGQLDRNGILRGKLELKKDDKHTY